jgi:hypothetical protein
VVESVLASLLAFSLIIVLVLAFVYASLRKRYSDARRQLLSHAKPHRELDRQPDAEAGAVTEKAARPPSETQSGWVQSRFSFVGVDASAVTPKTGSEGARTGRSRLSDASSISASSTYSAEATSSDSHVVLPTPAAMAHPSIRLSPDQLEQYSSSTPPRSGRAPGPRTLSAVTAVSTEWYHARAARTVPLRPFSLNSGRSSLASVNALTETEQMEGEDARLAVPTDQDGAPGKGDWARRFLSRRT